MSEDNLITNDQLLLNKQESFKPLSEADNNKHEFGFDVTLQKTINSQIVKAQEDRNNGIIEKEPQWDDYPSSKKDLGKQPKTTKLPPLPSSGVKSITLPTPSSSSSSASSGSVTSKSVKEKTIRPTLEQAFNNALKATHMSVAEYLKVLLPTDIKLFWDPNATSKIGGKGVWFEWSFENKLYSEISQMNIVARYYNILLQRDINPRSFALYQQLSAATDKKIIKRLKTTRKLINNLLMKIESSPFEQSVLSKLKTLCLASDLQEKMDKVSNWHPLQGGFIRNVRTGVIRVRTETDFYTKTFNVVWTERPVQEDLDIVDKFVAKLMCQDKELIQFLFVMTGLSICGDIKDKKIFFFVGDKGNNGKSSWLNLISGIVSLDLSHTFGNNALVESKAEGSSHTSHLNRLPSVYVAIASEFCSDSKLNVALLNQISGGDGVQKRKLHQEEGKKDITACHVIICSEILPKFTATKGFSKRMCVVPFNAYFTDEVTKDNFNTHEYIADENASLLYKDQNFLNALYYRIMKNVKDYFFDAKETYKIPEESLMIKQAEINEQDEIGDFISAYIIEDATHMIPVSVLRDHYNDLMKVRYPLTTRTIVNLLKKSDKIKSARTTRHKFTVEETSDLNLYYSKNGIICDIKNRKYVTVIPGIRLTDFDKTLKVTMSVPSVSQK